MLPLADIRIIAIEQYGAGPFGTLQLADLGAEVIKIEDPREGGDVGRYVPPYTIGSDSLFFETFNRNKRSLSLDMSTPGGRSVFESLVRSADVVFSNLRGDVPEKLGITYDDLKHLNPRIVCASLSGFGMTGPRRDAPGYDYVLQAMTGWMSITGEPDGPPTKSGLSLVDFSAGLVAAVSILSAVHAARRDGRGVDCDVSLYDTAMSMLTYVGTWQLSRGHIAARTRHSAHPSLIPFQAFPTKDDWIVVACPKEKFWKRLVVVLDRPEWSETGSPYATFADRHERAEELLPQLEAIFMTRDAVSWLRDLDRAGVPCGPVRDVASALADEHASARGLIVETSHPTLGEVRQVATAVRVGPRRAENRRAPMLNEDAEYVVKQVLGLDDDQIGALAASGAFGDQVRAAEKP